MLGCVVNEGVEPPALPIVRQDRRLAAGGWCARFRVDYLRHLDPSVQQFHLPVGALDPYVEFAQLPGDFVGARPQLRNWQGGQHLQL